MPIGWITQIIPVISRPVVPVARPPAEAPPIETGLRWGKTASFNASIDKPSDDVQATVIEPTRIEHETRIESPESPIEITFQPYLNFVRDDTWYFDLPFAGVIHPHNGFFEQNLVVHFGDGYCTQMIIPWNQDTLQEIVTARTDENGSMTFQTREHRINWYLRLTISQVMPPSFGPEIVHNFVDGTPGSLPVP
jgi:hypothetical protein